jgi:hypothetical protein
MQSSAGQNSTRASSPVASLPIKPAGTLEKQLQQMRLRVLACSGRPFLSASVPGPLSCDSRGGARTVRAQNSDQGCR